MLLLPETMGSVHFPYGKPAASHASQPNDIMFLSNNENTGLLAIYFFSLSFSFFSYFFSSSFLTMNYSISLSAANHSIRLSQYRYQYQSTRHCILY